LLLSLRYSYCLLFADDLNIYRIIQSKEDQILLQADLNNISQLAKDNYLSFNISKSAVMHIGSSNHRFSYFFNGVQLLPRDSIRDLGVLVDKGLKLLLQQKKPSVQPTTFLNPFPSLIVSSKSFTHLLFDHILTIVFRSGDRIIKSLSTCLRELEEGSPSGALA